MTVNLQKVRGSSPFDKSKIVDDLLTPCSAVDPEAIETNWMDVDGKKLFEPPVTLVSDETDKKLPLICLPTSQQV